jgi:hypothetical protein
MMPQQITTHHLQRLACLYVRQSTLQQVLAHTESTARQYALQERAVALGWPAERIVVIDQDLGHSEASATDRAGFQRLVAEVGLGKVGLVLGSRCRAWPGARVIGITCSKSVPSQERSFWTKMASTTRRRSTTVSCLG